MGLELYYTSAIVVFITVIILSLLSFVYSRGKLFSHNSLARNIILLIIGSIGLLLAILLLPISNESKQIILSTIGIIFGATVALSSTTFVSNGMSGMMMYLVRPFRVGDYIRTGDIFGRVTDHNLLYTSVQSPDRDVITIPNLRLMSTPLTTIRSSGTILSTIVTLGYDVPRTGVEKALTRAAEQAKLEYPFVHILTLGDFSITYKVGGLLTDTKSLITDRSDFKKLVVDALHEADIEIVSPTFMNQRVLKTDQRFIPRADAKEKEYESLPDNSYVPKLTTEDVVFDKAIEAELVGRIENNLSSINEKRTEMVERVRSMPDKAVRLEEQQKLRSLDETISEISKVIEAIKNVPEVENETASSQGLIRTKVLEYLDDLTSRTLSETGNLGKNIDEASRSLEDDQNKGSGRDNSQEDLSYAGKEI
ncbi:MAG: mechanosensitive ion channel [Euryarchaeota archaeon]|nr:mechanosensitive ion channel [Euryarchaeota archaeon]